MTIRATRRETYLYVNTVRTLMAYIDTKIAQAAANRPLQLTTKTMIL